MKIENFQSLIFELQQSNAARHCKQLNIRRLALVLGLEDEYLKSMEIARFCGNLWQFVQGRAAASTDPISPVFDVDLKQPWWQAQVVETHTFGSSGASQFLAAGSYFAPVAQVRDPTKTLSSFPTVLNTYIFGTFNGLGSYAIFGSGRYNTQYQLSEDVVKILGKHKLGFGAQFAQVFWSELPTRYQANGFLVPQTLNAFYNGGVGDNPGSDFTQLQQSFTSEGNLKLSFLSFAR